MYYLKKRIAELEKTFYLSICSADDAQKILGMNKMTCEDFERINYIVNSLGLDYFEIELSELFYLQSAELVERTMDRLDDKMLLEDVVMRYEAWLEEFVQQIQNPNLQLYFKEKLVTVRPQV
jgi:hypothetical protein